MKEWQRLREGQKERREICLSSKNYTFGIKYKICFYIKILIK